MRRLSLAPAVAAFVLPVLSGPAAAVTPSSVCTVALVNAAAGESSTCVTLRGTGQLGETWRSMTYAVSNGIVTAELGCGGDPVLSARRTVAGPGYASGTVKRDTWCWLTLTAVTDGASAAGESYPSIVIR